jgi:hypothetical protein
MACAEDAAATPVVAAVVAVLENFFYLGQLHFWRSRRKHIS